MSLDDQVAIMRGDLDRLRLRVDEAVGQPPSVERLKVELNNVGIAAAKAAMRDSLDAVRHAREKLAAAKDAAGLTEDAYRQAVGEAEFLLAGNFEGRSNKQWLARLIDGTPIPEDDQRSFTADEKKAWIQDAAGRQPEIRRLMVADADAMRARSRAQDDLAVADLGVTVAKHVLDAAAAELRFLALALQP